MKKILLLTLLVSFYSQLNSQSISVVAGLKENESVYIRWFSNSSFNIEGVNIYRKDIIENQWIKLNSLPIKRAEDVSKTSTDSTLKYYSILTYNLPSDPDDEGTWRLAVLAQGIFDSDFANFYGMQFIDKDAQAGKTYEYKIVKIINGSETEASISNQIKIESYEKPDSPKEFVNLDGDGFVKLKWNYDKKKFFAYNLYRKESLSGNGIRINEDPIFVFSFRDNQGKAFTSDYYFTDTSIINGKTYYFQLSGVDFLGRESKLTQEIKALPKDLTPPPSAFDVKTVIKSDSIIISWQLEKVKDLKEINILRSTDFNGPFTRINNISLNTNSSNYIDLIKEYQPAYYYVIESIDFSGNSSLSYPKVAIIPDLIPPAIPKDLSAVGEVGRVILQWSKNQEIDLAGYFIWRSMGGEEDDFLLLTTEPYNSNIYIDSLNKEISNVITYRIKAIDNSFNESEYSKKVNVRMKDVTPPEKPLLVSVTDDSSVIRINWIKNSEPDLLGYNIFISLDQNKFIQPNNKPVLSDFYVTEVKISGDYKVYITALDSVGNISENSDTLECYVISEAKSDQELKIISAKFNPVKKSFLISWNKLENISGYIVYRREKNEDLSEAISDLITDNNFEDNIPEEVNYFYSVRAFDNNGNVFISEEVSP